MAALFIGLLLGLLAAIGVAWYLQKKPASPVATDKQVSPAKLETTKPQASAKLDEALAKPEEKPRFDFYKILPGVEEPATAKESKFLAPKENLFLQAGAFQSAADADNLKARLALLGLEASIQTTTLPEKGVWHRVRLGPFTKNEDLEHTRSMLKQNGIEPVLIKARVPASPQRS